MRKGCIILMLLLASIAASARHVAGGELFYEYVGPGPTPATTIYKISLHLFRDCFSSGPLLENENVSVGVYNNSSGNLVASLGLNQVGAIQTITLNTASFPCLSGNVNVCYQYGLWSTVITLPDNNSGYTLSRIGCCRVDNISNLIQKTSVGSNYVTKIPGLSAMPTGHNSSPQFNLRDTALVCANKSFKLDFGAVDPDGDDLSYSFCDAYTASSGSNNSPPQNTLNLLALPYAPPFNGNSPLGGKVTINAATGIISGIAPPEGQYVVNVCITEYRNGRPFAEHRKDFILKVQNCDFIEAVLPEKIIQCDTFTVHFENLSASSAITSYSWDFGDPAGTKSTLPFVDFTYPDTGRYQATLNVTGPRGCIGQASTTVYVYPGFKPAFNMIGSCYQNPFQFTDATTTKYGTVNSWLWNFGDETTNADTAITKKASYTYTTPATRLVSLVVTNTKGCMDSVHKDLVISDKPLLQLPFRDTLICSIDTLAIPVNNTGNFTWTSKDTHILLANTSRPLVFPKDTANYIVNLTDNGCVNSDSVRVNVLPFIKVNLGKDTLICQTDTIRLFPVSQALGYTWNSSTGEKVQSVKNPIVQPLITTNYYVLVNLGKCQDKDTVQVKVVNYPLANAGPDTTLCFGSRVQLNAQIKGANFTWSPTNSLLNPTAKNPIAGPSRTTAYILRVTDTLGCPKPSTDTILVTIIPPIPANAGRDTFALPGQPLQLNATGGNKYVWSPENYLSDPSIGNPIAIFDDKVDSIRYKVRVFDSRFCFAEDEIVIHIFRSGPDIYVPSAFTPNSDGKNDVLRPFTVGISKLNYFSVYNRWGQLMFSTSELGKGWDGKYLSALQPSAAYVYATEGVDYTGKLVFRKGTSVLIR